jgi:ketosteroid isomerase-like protein
MSEENVKVVRQALDATSGGDPNAPQAVFDPSIEWDMSGVAGWLEERVYRGEEVGEFLRAWAGSWRHWHFDFSEVREAGEDRVFAAIHEVGIGTESDVAVEQDRYLVFTLRGRRVVRVQMFSDKLAALEAAGLSE